MITKNPIQFTKLRFFFIGFSIFVILLGWGSLFFNGGFNLGIDFTGGVDKQFQIAPMAFTVKAAGTEEVQVNITNRALSLIYPGRNNEIKQYPLADYSTIQALTTALKQVENLTVDVRPAALNVPSANLLSLTFPVNVDKQTLIVNYLAPTGGVVARIDDVRAALAPMGTTSLQYVGRPENQEYLLKIQVKNDGKGDKKALTATGESEFLAQKDKEVADLLSAKFGRDSVIMKKTDYIGASFSVKLLQDAIYAVFPTLILILAYIAFRFHWVYGVGGIIATIHDVLVMLGFVALFRWEANSATLAAVLTLMGYSINDTIVVYDRIRENFGLMPNVARDTVINTSITQTLSRTIITNLTVFLSIICVYIFATGQIKEFALFMTVSIVVGTYSTIFIASPIVLGGLNRMDKRKKIKELGPQAAAALAAKPVKSAEKLGEAVEAAVKATKAAPVAAPTGKVEVVREQRKTQKRKKQK